jgi:hypothetical protein
VYNLHPLQHTHHTRTLTHTLFLSLSLSLSRSLFLSLSLGTRTLTPRPSARAWKTLSPSLRHTSSAEPPVKLMLTPPPAASEW